MKRNSHDPKRLNDALAAGTRAEELVIWIVTLNLVGLILHSSRRGCWLGSLIGCSLAITGSGLYLFTGQNAYLSMPILSPIAGGLMQMSEVCNKRKRLNIRYPIEADAIFLEELQKLRSESEE